jgi:hypothetical protein
VRIWKTFVTFWVVLTLFTFGCLVWKAYNQSFQIHATVPSTGVAAQPLPKTAGHGVMGRPLYAFSLIPHGFETQEEFEQRLASDPTLAAWFGPCNEDARFVTLPEDTTAFLSYRFNGRIQYSKKATVLKKGERVMLRCGKAILLRCANSFSLVPATPSGTPPGDITTPIPEPPTITAEDYDLPAIPPHIDLPPSIPTGGGNGYVPYGGVCCFYETKPVATPEPGTLTLLLVGTVGLLALWHIKLQRDKR